MLAGRLPFRAAGPLGLAAQRAVIEPPPLASVAHDVPVRIGRVIDRCLARAPRRRWSDASAFAAALARAARPARGWRAWLARLARFRSAGYHEARPVKFSVVGE
jgi:hypothetical protein